MGIAWLYLTAASVVNGSITVSVTGNHDLSSVETGWSFDIGSARAEILSGTAADDSGNSTLTLARPWVGANMVGQEAQIVPTSGALRAAIVAMNDTNDYAIETHQTLTEIATLDKDVTITDPAGEEHTFPSLPKIAREVGEQRTSLAIDFSEKVASLVITASLGYKNAVERDSGGRETIIVDAQGNENLMCVIPRMNYEDLGLPDLNLGTGTMTAFLTDGVARSEVLISKFINSTPSNGGFASIGGAFPRNSINFDSAKSLCTAKGAGWHLMSQHEFELLKFISMAHGVDVRGNTNWGRAHDALFENATRYDGKASGDTSGDGRTKAGQGSLSWSHDGTPYGVMDLIGNVWEWVDQFKIIDGRVYCTSDNNTDLAEASWVARDVYYDHSSGIRLSDSVIATSSTNINPASSIAESATYVQSELMRRLGIEHATASVSGSLYVNNVGECLPVRGGSWYFGSNAGLAALYLNAPRSNSDNYIGSRSAFFA